MVTSAILSLMQVAFTDKVLYCVKTMTIDVNRFRHEHTRAFWVKVSGNRRDMVRELSIISFNRLHTIYNKIEIVLGVAEKRHYLKPKHYSERCKHGIWYSKRVVEGIKSNLCHSFREKIHVDSDKGESEGHCRDRGKHQTILIHRSLKQKHKALFPFLESTNQVY